MPAAGKSTAGSHLLKFRTAQMGVRAMRPSQGPGGVSVVGVATRPASGWRRDQRGAFDDVRSAFTLQVRTPAQATQLGEIAFEGARPSVGVLRRGESVTSEARRSLFNRPRESRLQ